VTLDILASHRLPLGKDVGKTMTDDLGHEGTAEESKRVLVISRRGPPDRPFGWEICDDSGEIARSAETFRSRDEAIADGRQTLDSSFNL
jgi:hypothetical protein